MADRDLIRELRAQVQAIESGGAVPTGGFRVSANPGDCPALGKNSAPRRQAPASRVGENSSIEENDGSDRAFKKIIALVNVSDRSERAIRQRLAQSGYSREAIESAVERALEYALVDDARYADQLIRSRLAQGKGMAGIERELLANDIDPCNVDGWPHEYGVDQEAEINRALAVLDRKPPRSKNIREGAFRRLVQKGYSTSTASTAARLWCESVR